MSHNMKDCEIHICYKEGCFVNRLGFGYPGGDKISCKRHKDDIEGLIEQVSKCTYKGCPKKGHNKIPNSRYRFCALHRDLLIKEGLPVDGIKARKSYHPKCIEDGCGISATYDNRMYCSKHSKTGKSVDRRRCGFEGCTSTKRPTYGFGVSRTRCKLHQEPGMVSHNICSYEGCSISAAYGAKNAFCYTHRYEDNVDEGVDIDDCIDLCAVPFDVFWEGYKEMSI